MIAGATSFKTRMEKDELIDTFVLSSDWPGKEMDGSIESAYSLSASELRVHPQVFRVFVAGQGSHILALCLINSPYHLPRAHNDCFLGSTVTARSRVGIKGAYCRLL